MKSRSKSYLLLFLTSAIWGIAGPVIKFTLSEIPTFIFLLYRFAIAGIVAAIILIFTKIHWPKKFVDKLWIIVYCFLTSTVALGLLFLGYEKTSALSASVINAIYPITVSVVGVSFLHEHVTRREKIGMGIALAGTILIIIEPLFNHNLSPQASLAGNLLILASLLVGVILAVLAKVLLRHQTLTPLALTQLSFLIGLITILPITLFFYSPISIFQSLTSMSLAAHAGVWYMAILSGTIAYSLWHRAQKTIEIGETAMFSYTYPLFTIPLSILWLHEIITPIFILSSLLITIGVILAETKKL